VRGQGEEQEEQGPAAVRAREEEGPHNQQCSCGAISCLWHGLLSQPASCQYLVSCPCMPSPPTHAHTHMRWPLAVHQHLCVGVSYAVLPSQPPSHAQTPLLSYSPSTLTFAKCSFETPVGSTYDTIVHYFETDIDSLLSFHLPTPLYPPPSSTLQHQVRPGVLQGVRGVCAATARPPTALGGGGTTQRPRAGLHD
jgi:hypothetical protein